MAQQGSARRPWGHAAGRTGVALAAFALALAVLSAPPWTAHAATITVNTTADVVDPEDGACSLREAIIAANTDTASGAMGGECAAGVGADEITLGAGTYTLSIVGLGENAAAAGDLDVSTEITIEGAGAAATIIDADGIDRVFDVLDAGNLTLRGVAVINGAQSLGGGIFNTATLVIEDSTVAGHTSSGHAGGIYNEGTLTVTGSTVSNNTASGLGGGLHNANDGDATVTSSTFSNNTASSNGGGLYNASDATVTNSTFSDNTASVLGGGLHNANEGDATVTSSTFSGNSATNEGGGIYHAGGSATLTLTNTIVANSLAGGDCTHAFTGGDPTGGNNLVEDGSCGFVDGVNGNVVADPDLGALADNGGPTETMALLPGGPAINAGDNAAAAGIDFDQRGTGFPRIFDATVDIGAYELQAAVPTAFVVDSILDTADDDPGDEVCATAGGVCTLRAAIEEAEAWAGSAQSVTFDAGVFGGGATITLASMLPNVTSAGGALTIDGTGQAVTISGGGAVRPFVVDAGGELTLAGLTVSGGSAAGDGGGLLNNGTLTVTGSTFSDNSGGIDGGGIYNNDGALTVTGSTLSNNSVVVGDGGGISINGGTLTVTGSTFSDNTIDGRGGGIYNLGGMLTVTGSTFSDNSADHGGGINNFAGGTLTLTGSTLDGNSATAGGGLRSSNSTATVTNTIIANSPTGGDCDVFGGGLTSGGHNLVETPGACSFAAAGDLTGVDPVLGALADNGGPTETMALLPGSPAINAGDNDAAAGIDFDQRGTGFLRIVGGTVDIGAFELQVATPTAFEVNSTGDGADAVPGDALCADAGGVCTLRAAIEEAEAWAGSAQSVTFAPALDGQTITLGSTLPGIWDAAGIEIDGGGTVTLSGGGVTGVRILDIAPAAVVEVSGLTFRDGRDDPSTPPSVHGGGAIRNRGTLTVSDSTFTGNTSRAGGAIFNDHGVLTITGSTFTANTNLNLNGGGGGAILSNGTLEVTNSTFSGNVADGQFGGGIYTGGAAGAATISSSTFAGNTAHDGGGGGILLDGGTLTLTNTILAGSLAGGDCVAFGTLTDGGNNLVQDGSCGFPAGGDPMLVALADNGGPTETHALLDGSPAIDAGAGGAGCPAADQRGVARPQGAACDIGAFEFEPNTLALVVDSTGDEGDATPGDEVCATAGGVCTLRAAIEEAEARDGSAQSITFNAALNGQTITLDSTLPTITDAAGLEIDGGGTVTLSGGDTDGTDGVRILDIAAGATAEVRGLTFTDGIGSGQEGGGAIRNLGTLTVEDSTFTNNRANRTDTACLAGYTCPGSAISNRGTLTVTDSTFVDNIVGGTGIGSAIASAPAGVTASLAVTGSTFTGAGTFVDVTTLGGTSTVTVADSTFSTGLGGAIFVWNGVTGELTNVTIVTASTQDSVGADNGAALVMTNSIVVNSGGGWACFPVGLTGTDNIVFDVNAAATCPTLDPGENQFDVDPGLGPLGDHGGPTQTYALLAGSPAIDAGDAGECSAADQRGVLRVGTCDIGAFEFDTTAPTAFVVDSTADLADAVPGDGLCADALGDCTVRAAVEEAEAWADSAQAVTFDAALDGQTITLDSTLPTLTDTAGLEIDGGGTVTLSGGDTNGDDGVRILDIATGATAEVRGLTFRDATAPSTTGGGAIRNLGTLTVTESTFTNNRASQASNLCPAGNVCYGGAILNMDGTLTVADSVFTDNIGQNASAIANLADVEPASLTVTGSTFSGASLVVVTNAITGVAFPTTTISDSTFSATGGSQVVYIAGQPGNTATLTNVTVHATTVNSAIALDAGTSVVLTNSIVLNEGTGAACSGGSFTGTNNIVIDNNVAATCPTLLPGDGNQIDADPLLDALADNGGPTPTMALLFGSPAVGAGDLLECSANDQRGQPREGTCDIGAFEQHDRWLDTLVLSAGAPLVPAFAGGTPTYTLDVAEGVDTTTVTPATALGSTATIAVEGVGVVSGAASAAIGLDPGTNAIEVVVTGLDGLSSTYTVTVTRAASTDATLAGLVLSAGTPLDPPFATGTPGYMLDVPNATASTTVTATTTDAGATLVLVVDGGAPTALTSAVASAPVALTAGDDTVIEVIVTAADGVTPATYTVTVARAPSTDATLAGLVLSAGTPLVPPFATGTEDYTLAVASTTASTTVTATTADPGATLALVVDAGAPTALTSAVASAPVALAAGGDTVIEVRVTAQDGVTPATYTVTVTRAAAPPPPPPADDDPPPPTDMPPGTIDVDGVPVDDLETTPVSPDGSTEVTIGGPEGDTVRIVLPPPDGPPGNVTLEIGIVDLDAIEDDFPPPPGTTPITGIVVRLTDEDGIPLTDALDPPAEVTFTLTPDTLGGTPPDELVLVRYTPDGWVEAPSTVVTGPDGTVTLTGTADAPGLYAVLHAPDWGMFTTPLFPGVTFTIWTGGGYDRLEAALDGRGAVWVVVDGVFMSYGLGTPDFVNAAFLARFPGGIPVGTPVFVVR